jgi:hypothetical protein
MMPSFAAELISPGHAYSVGKDVPTYGGDGKGIEVDIQSVDRDGGVRELTISQQGSGYAAGNVLVITGPGDATFRLRAAGEIPGGTGISPWVFIAIFGIVVAVFIFRRRARKVKSVMP